LGAPPGFSVLVLVSELVPVLLCGAGMRCLKFIARNLYLNMLRELHS